MYAHSNTLVFFVFFCSYSYIGPIYALLNNIIPFFFYQETITIMKVLTLHQVLYDNLKLAVDIT